MEDPSTDTLRKLAPCWTLAGDEQLLNILQSTHKRLLSRCQEANCQLEQMAIALDDANISLQNVNNQFMALSSRQFIESRVYDDDDLSTVVPVVKEPPKPEVPDELSCLKRSIAVLENTHEMITILNDSDTDSDSDEDNSARLVMKPKDIYADRPLPYIIGSESWKNKWHAGLLLEDSESDSSACKPEEDSEQYSQSEPEDTHTDKLRVPDTNTTISETSSELPSEQGSVPKPTPSDVASEIARRLGGREPPKMVEEEPAYEEPAKPTVRKVYRPQDPVSSTIFPDEPPPLSDHSDSQESDIFADLHRSQPYARNNVADDLFGFDNENGNDSDDGDIFSDFANKPVTDPSAKPPSIFEQGPTPHMFEKTSTDGVTRSQGHQHTNTRSNEHQNNNIGDKSRRDDKQTSEDEVDRVKKPVGGISLFGNKGTESIGAAILKRNQRKPSTSGEDSESDSRSELQSNQQIKKEKDIFDDLFARSEGKNKPKEKGDFVKDIKNEIQKKNEGKIKDNKFEKPKVDLFSDNLFDDIDDIFSTNVVKMPTKETKSKSIFEDDDDLFSEIAAPKPVKIEAASGSNNKKSLFDSDDELFSENVPVSKSSDTPKVNAIEEISKPSNSINISEPSKISKDITKSIFDDDDDDIFSDVKTKIPNEPTKVQNTPVDNEKTLSKNNEFIPKHIEPPKTSSTVFKSPSLFDEDDDDTDLFGEPAKPTIIQKQTTQNTNQLENRTKIPKEEIPQNSAKLDDIEEYSIENHNVNFINESIESNEIINAKEIINNTPEIKDESKPSVNTDVDSIVNHETNASRIIDEISKNIQNIEQSSSDTNDFSDQDFDDLPPKIEKADENLNINTNLASEITENLNIFDKNTLEQDIFAKSDNTDVIKATEPVIESKKTEIDNKPEQLSTKTIETDIFSDIVTEPPVFEKPKEPKKSKNVNALFDDDSDDESLFFKKNDPIFDENPVDFVPSKDRIFGLFADEPPDVGFSKIGDEIYDDMFSNLPKPNLPQNDNLPPIPDQLENVNLSNDSIKPDAQKIDAIKDIPSSSSVPEFDDDTVLQSPKESSINIEKDPKPKDKQPNIPASLSDDEQLFKAPDNISKPTFAVKSSPDILSDDDNLFTTVPKLDKPSPLPTKEAPVPSKNTEIDIQDNDLFSFIEKPTNSEIFARESDDSLFKKPKTPELTPKSEVSTTETKSEPKKVGKLKVGLNINVNALLPGASPKKVKPSDQTDGQSQNVSETLKTDTVTPKTYLVDHKSDIEKAESQNTVSKLLKSVSFDGKPESEVLDNKLSKERPRIQVKRRPSTRKARREAVRKSGIDFGEDSTDNSSSIDDPPRIVPRNPLETTKITDTDRNEIKQIQAENNEQEIPETQLKTTEKEAVIVPENTQKQDDITDRSTNSKDVKSKVVYILNDEDIFNTSPKEDLTKTTDSVKKPADLDSNTGVITLGKVYDKTSTKKDMKSSLFGDESDDEIFKGKATVKKTSIVDSDGEEELFGTSRKEETKEVKKEVKKEVVKGSLFGDEEDDDDDLFGVKTKKSVEHKPQPSRSTAKETPKPSQPVFEDPLSMFGDDD